MASYPTILRHLPSLYCPEADDNELLARFLRATAAIIDEAERESTMIMQAHWFNYADDPRFDNYFNLYQKRIAVESAEDAENIENTIQEDNNENRNKALLSFNHIHDLAKLSALFQLPPWQDAIGKGETVAHYRKRVAEMVHIYRNGLGTLSSLRQVIAAQLPDDSVDGKTQELAFIVEEFASKKRQLQAIEARGIPTEILGPLMRFQLDNKGLSSTQPTLYIEANASSDSSERPLIELFSEDDDKPCRIGIAYEGDLPAGQTLRLSPRYHLWLASVDGLQQASSDQASFLPSFWQPITDTPVGEIKCLLQVRDHTVWLVIDNALHSFDGRNWQQRLTALPEVHHLLEHEDSLLIATDNGLLQLPMYPQNNIFVPQPAIAELDGIAIYHLYRLLSGTWWAATAEGVKVWEGDRFSDILMGSTDITLPVYHIQQDNSGTITLATERGAIQYQPVFNHWYLFIGGESSDTATDWLRFKEGDTLPTSNMVFLPTVNTVLRSRDATLWFGTGDGIACYRATAVRDFSYRTHLQAFPQLNTGNVTHIYQDSSGILWFTCEQGLLRFDGQHWQQLQNSEWVRILTTHEISQDTSAWRYQREQQQWQVYHADRKDWESVVTGTLLANTDKINALLWTSSAHASLGAWDGEHFNEDNTASVSSLRMRYKPIADKDTRIVNGGIPGIPALPVGQSIWRYLKLESELDDDADTDDELSNNHTRWTYEGRLILSPEDRSLLSLSIEEGRFSAQSSPLSYFDQAVFSYKPAAKVWFSWQANQPLTLQANLQTTENQIDPYVLDRVWDGIQQVRPAGVHIELLVNNDSVRGEPNG